MSKIRNMVFNYKQKYWTKAYDIVIVNQTQKQTSLYIQKIKASL